LLADHDCGNARRTPKKEDATTDQYELARKPYSLEHCFHVESPDIHHPV